jgi:deoxyadenosine/deoxycytidine kinase
MFNDRHPNYEKLRSLRGGIYVIEGIIGVGKTTLGKSLEKYLNNIGIKCKFYKEYFNKDLLDQFITDMKKYAYFFQMMMLVKRIEIYKEAEEFSKLGGVSFIDRSLVGDMTFAKMHYKSGNISDDEWQIYNNFIKREKLLTPTACIYLRCNMKTTLFRIQNRGITSEINGYTTKYLIELNDMYNDVIKDTTNIKTICLDWDKSVKLVDNIISEDNLLDILNLLL